jgi:hypothetical protein
MKLLDQVRHLARVKHFSYRTDEEKVSETFFAPQRRKGS